MMLIPCPFPVKDNFLPDHFKGTLFSRATVGS